METDVSGTIEGDAYDLTVLVVGGDRLGSIPRQLATQGFTEVIHWRGRQRGKVSISKPLPERVDRIIVFCDFVRHDLARRMKREAKGRSIPITFCRRSLSWLRSHRDADGAGEDPSPALGDLLSSLDLSRSDGR